MSEFKRYEYNDDSIELRPVTSEEIDEGINETPVYEGDMILRKDSDEDNEWLITEEYFKAHFKVKK